MKRIALRAGIVAFASLVALNIVLAQGVQIRTEDRTRAQSAIRAKSILGAKVHLEGNTSVGTIEDIIFDEEGVIDYLIVSEGGKMVTVPWEAAKIDYEKRSAIIQITPESYRKIPTYTTAKYPEFYTPRYQTEIYSYYNLKPGQARKFERRIRR